jgi:hypothetical protein
MFKLGSSRKVKDLASMLGLKYNQVASADLPCGYTCPMADKCKSYADRISGKITDAPTCEFRCYGTSLEAAFPSVRALHWNNFDAVMRAGTTDKITDLLLSAITPTIKVLRVHSFGDFFKREYFDAWVNVAEYRPDVSFFAYTKVLPYIDLPRPVNFSMVYSFGGKLDGQVTNQPVAYVVRSVADADALNVPVSCQLHPADDYNYIVAGQSFALLLHGTQPAKS